MVTIKNLNAHQICVERADGTLYEYPPCGHQLRLEIEDKIIAEVSGNQIIQRVFYEPERGIVPTYEKGVYYIVPSQITQLYNRADFISPDTKQVHGARRDDHGQVLSVRRFRMNDILVKRK